VTKGLFYLAVLAGPAAVGFYVWRNLTGLPPSGESKRKLLLSSAVVLSGNILLLWCFCVVDWVFLGKHAPSQETLREHAAVMAISWITWAGAALSIFSITLASFSERVIARKVCIIASAFALAYWSVTNVALTDVLAVYSISHP
jgi:hypothetical protein